MHPLRAALELPIAHRDVVQDRVAGDRGLGLAGGRVAQQAADVEGELDLPVDLFRVAWQHDRVARTDQRACEFVEERRMLRELRVLLAQVGLVVLAHADDLRRVRDRRCQVGVSQRKGLAGSAPDLLQRARGEDRADIGEVERDYPVALDPAGPGAACCPHRYQSHPQTHK